MLWIDPYFKEDWSPPPDYETVAALAPVDDYHEKQGRSTGRYWLPGLEQDQSVYIKKYRRLPWWMRWLAPLRLYPGPLELEYLRSVGELGILVPQALLAGASRKHECRSFLVIRALTGFEALHRYVPKVVAGQNTASPAHRRALCRRLAESVGRLHAAHIYHRDLYLCHFFLRRTGPGADEFDLALIDFLRLKRSRRPRWRTKDLAQLLFSSQEPGVSRTDRLRFLKHYLGQRRLDHRSRRLIRRLENKAARYTRHNERLKAAA